MELNNVGEGGINSLWNELPCALLQKLLSDERFVSVETGSDEKQLLNQVLNAIKVTPSLNEDLQVEVMKVSDLPMSVLATETVWLAPWVCEQI